MLAKQLVNLRKQKTKSYGMSAKVSAIGSQAKAMQSNVHMADAMKTTTNVSVTIAFSPFFTHIFFLLRPWSK